MNALTIVWTPTPGNRLRLLLHAGFALAMGAALCGCEHRSPHRVPSWELTQAVELTPALTWRVRMTDGRSVPPDLVQPLCDEFDLVHIRTAAQWRQLRRALDLSNAYDDRAPDFSRGSIVALIARLGEPAAGTWPIALQEARLDGSDASLRFWFGAGLYYPLETAPFFTATYVPGLKTIRVVHINRRTFAFNPD
ncbi:MAG: hypothetical protein JXA69_00495 [Phycisphaerae bacterium]|nr:hypothetical protein [Phycisphaerae bacterium]